MGALDGRRAMVVGASSGTGRACAIALSRAGADVVFAARRTAQLEAAVAEAGSGHVITIDVLDSDDIRRAVDRTAATLGGLDIVLYTAGASALVPLRDMTADEWQRIYAINLFGANLVIAAALPHLAPDGIVAVVSSDSANQPRHSLVPYASAKAALEATMEGWRTEEPGGRRFTTIVIGPTWPTEFGDGFTAEAMAAIIPHWQRQGFRTAMLAADDVAAQVTAAFGVMCTSPTFGVETLFLRGPEPEVPEADFGASRREELTGG